jgi:hypothetical protein
MHSDAQLNKVRAPKSKCLQQATNTTKGWASSLTSLGRGQESKSRLADATGSTWCTARQFARGGWSLRRRSRRRLHLLRRSMVVLDRPVILFIGGFLNSVQLALCALNKSRGVALADHADGASGHGT